MVFVGENELAKSMLEHLLQQHDPEVSAKTTA